MTTKSNPLSTSEFYLGLDIGSVSLNTVVISENNNILQEHYDYIHGKPFHVLKERLSGIFSEYPEGSLKGIALTGTGGKLATRTHRWSICK